MPIVEPPIAPVPSKAKAKVKRETNAEREIRVWHEYCDAIVRERREHLREEELEMLESQRRDDKPPTGPRREYAAHIKWETELLTGKDGVTVAGIMQSVATIKPLLRTFEEEEEQFSELQERRPTRLPRREVQWLMSVARRWAM